jgi:hypothetical protein
MSPDSFWRPRRAAAPISIAIALATSAARVVALGNGRVEQRDALFGVGPRGALQCFAHCRAAGETFVERDLSGALPQCLDAFDRQVDFRLPPMRLGHEAHDLVAHLQRT